MLASLERGEWKSVKNLHEEIKKARAAAVATAKKDARMNLRISRRDMIALKSKALKEGIPYQTLVAGIIHKYVEGRLRERIAGIPCPQYPVILLPCSIFFFLIPAKSASRVIPAALQPMQNNAKNSEKRGKGSAHSL